MHAALGARSVPPAKPRFSPGSQSNLLPMAKSDTICITPHSAWQGPQQLPCGPLQQHQFGPAVFFFFLGGEGGSVHPQVTEVCANLES